jgi:transglycosylase-like protein
MRKHRLAGVVIAVLIGLGLFAQQPISHHATPGRTRAGMQLLSADVRTDHVISTAVPTVSGPSTVAPSAAASTELRGAVLEQLANHLVTALSSPLGPQALAWDVRMEQLAHQEKVNTFLSAVVVGQAKTRAYVAAAAVAASRRRVAPAAPTVAPVAVHDPLAALRACESGGNYADDTGNGYYGAYQFTLGTWRSLGLGGLPNQASAAEQDQAAQTLAARRGWGQWPACARRLGLT